MRWNRCGLGEEDGGVRSQKAEGRSQQAGDAKDISWRGRPAGSEIMNRYFVGVDLGQARDYTAIAVVERAETTGAWDAAMFAWRMVVFCICEQMLAICGFSQMALSLACCWWNGWCR